MKRFVFITILFIAGFCSAALAQNHITLTTFYPAPFGIYKEMRVMGFLGVGSTYPGITTGQTPFQAKVYIDTDSTSTDAYFVASSGTIQTAGKESFVVGENASAGQDAIAMGEGAFAANKHDVAIGIGSYASGTSQAFGNGAKATNGSIAIGNGAKASGFSTVAIGDNVEANDYGSFVVGRNNIVAQGADNLPWVATDQIFAIGNGQTSTTPSNAMTILKNGDVGIGTVAPASLLHLSSAGPTQQFMDATADTAYSQLGFFENNTPKASVQSVNSNFATVNRRNNLELGTWTAADITLWTNLSEKMRITSAGNVGIGTTAPGGKLHIAMSCADMIFSSNAVAAAYTTMFYMDDTGLSIGHDNTHRDFRLKTGNLPRLTILGNGDVGIGTTAPMVKLDVQGGDIRINDGNTSTSTVYTCDATAAGTIKYSSSAFTFSGMSYPPGFWGCEKVGANWKWVKLD
ncbi:MAG: hypothetical protein NT079_06990 [Candidatus Omnitrophica bacterium]|nr:hypothetical protein [Candidatus Omnitrophota bacterium]